MSDNISGDTLKQIVSKIERLENDKQIILSHIKDVYDEAKSVGFDQKILKQIIKIRKMDKNKRQEHEALLDLYLSALGMSGD